MLEILEVLGYENGEFLLKPLFVFEEEGEDEQGCILGQLKKKGDLVHEKKLLAAGLQLL